MLRFFSDSDFLISRVLFLQNNYLCMDFFHRLKILPIWFKYTSVLWYLRTACNRDLQLLFVILKSWSKPLWTWTVMNRSTNCLHLYGKSSVKLFYNLYHQYNIVLSNCSGHSRFYIRTNANPALIIPSDLRSYRSYRYHQFSVLKYVYLWVGNTCCIQNSLFSE